MEDRSADIPKAGNDFLHRNKSVVPLATTLKRGFPNASGDSDHRGVFTDQPRKLLIGIVGLILLLAVLIVNVYETFILGRWETLLVTVGLILLAWRVRRHYSRVEWQLRHLDEILAEIPIPEPDTPAMFDPKASTAVLLVKEYNGFGVHSLLSIPRLFPGVFKNIVFLSVVKVDVAKLKGTPKLQELERDRRDELQNYVKLANQLGFGSEFRIAAGADIIEETEMLSAQIAKECPRSIFFAGKLVFERDRWYRRILHNETAYAIQRRLQFDALNCMVLPVRVFANQKA